MNLIKLQNFLTLLILIILLLFPFTILAEENIIMGVTSKKIGLSKLESWKPILDEVSKRSGINIELIVAKDHHALIEIMKDGRIDMGYFSPVFYVKARKELNCIPIVLEKRLDSSYYQGGFIVRKDSNINSLDDLKGKRLALTAEGDSTSGYYLPIAMLNREGISYQKDLNVVFTGKHINVLKSVTYGLVDAGAIKLFILEEPANKKYISQVNIIAKSSSIPTSSVAVRKDMDSEIIARLEKAFLSLNNDERGLKAMKNSGYDGFAKSTDQMYDIVRKYLADFKIDY